MRRPSSLNNISLLTGLAVAIFSTAIFLLFCFIFYLDIKIEELIAYSVIIFFTSFILFKYVLNSFINNKIKIIYKTIGKPMKHQKDTQRANDAMLQKVERDVAEWAINKNKQIRELKKMEQYRKEFVGNVSHELKTPIFNAQGYIETLLDSDLEDKEFTKSYLHKASVNIDRLETIVADLLEISKFETGRIQLNKTAFDLVKLVKKVFFQFQHLAEEHKVRLQVNAEEGEIFVIGDENRIMQVLENLISNSIKYGNEGGATIVRFYDMDEQYLVEVSDNGPGIEEEHLPRLFERFYRADRSRARKVGGTGLGLAIVKNIIEAHEQTISVSSKPGEGTTFNFTLQKSEQE
jgi:two-component system phosphate regulon sensor histidine kinase PhoR